MTAASFKDATRYLVGAKNYEGTWARVDIPETSSTTGKAYRPGPLGWFASSQGQDLGPGSVFLWGGLREDSTRSSEGWILSIES